MFFQHNMFHKEKKWIVEKLESIVELGTTAIDIGSDTPEYREIQQPYIFDLYRYLMFDRGITISTLDINPETEADFICDLSQNQLPHELGTYDLVICSNFLEHVEESGLQTARNHILNMTDKYLVVTVPYNLPHHGRPIDNMFRPTIEELINFFPELVPICALNWVDEHYREPFISNPNLAPYPEVTGVIFLKPNYSLCPVNQIVF